LLVNANRRFRTASARLTDGRYEAMDVLEPAEGALEIRVAVTIAGDEVAVDYDGTSPQHDGNLNCPLSVTRSATYFVVRCLTAPDVPASGGAFAPVTVTAAPGSLVNARPPAAVAAGNVETSCRIVDVLVSALGEGTDVPAAAPGDTKLGPMERGRVVAIHIGAEHGRLPQPVDRVRAHAGKGLEGNRYFFEKGARPGQALTLIGSEAIEAFTWETGIPLTAQE